MKSLIAAAITAFVILIIAIIGSTVAHAGNHIPNAEIVVVKQGGNERFVARTDDSGRFSMKGLPAGEYNVSISESGFKQAIALDQASGRGVADFYLKISATRSPLNPVGVRRFFAGIPITVGADGTMSGSLSTSNNVKSPRDPASGMASGR